MNMPDDDVSALYVYLEDTIMADETQFGGSYKKALEDWIDEVTTEAETPGGYISEDPVSHVLLKYYTAAEKNDVKLMEALREEYMVVSRQAYINMLPELDGYAELGATSEEILASLMPYERLALFDYFD